MQMGIGFPFEVTEIFCRWIVVAQVCECPHTHTHTHTHREGGHLPWGKWGMKDQLRCFSQVGWKDPQN